MKKTRLLALVLALLLAFSLTACGEKESRKPIEIMKASMAKQWDVKSAHSVIKGSMSFAVPEALVTPDQKMILDALKDATLEVETLIDTEAGKGHLKGEIKAAGGVNFSGEAFILSENEMVLSTPLLPQQLVINLVEFKEMYEKETGQKFPDVNFTNPSMQEDFKPLMDTALDFVGDMIKDEKAKVASEEVQFSTGKEKVTTVSFSYKDKEVSEAMLRLVENAINSDNFLKYIEQTAELNKKMGVQGAELQTENLKAELQTAREEFPKNKEQIQKMMESYVTFKNMEFSFSVDKDDYMRASTFKLDLEVKNPFDPAQTIPLKMDFSASTDQYNAVKVEAIPTTQVDPANSIKLQDLVKQNMQ